MYSTHIICLRWEVALLASHLQTSDTPRKGNGCIPHLDDDNEGVPLSAGRSRACCSLYSFTRLLISTRCSSPNSRASLLACARFLDADKWAWRDAEYDGKTNTGPNPAPRAYGRRLAYVLQDDRGERTIIPIIKIILSFHLSSALAFHFCPGASSQRDPERRRDSSCAAHARFLRSISSRYMSTGPSAPLPLFPRNVSYAAVMAWNRDLRVAGERSRAYGASGWCTRTSS